MTDKLPESLPLDILLEATVVYGALKECERTLTAGHRCKLLDQIKNNWLPILISHQHFPPVRRILETYNHNIPLSNYSFDYEPIKLD